MRCMNAVKLCRKRLNLTQSALAAALGVSQGNVSFYEQGQTLSPAVAAKLIEFAASRGVAITYEEIYEPYAVTVPHAEAKEPAARANEEAKAA